MLYVFHADTQVWGPRMLPTILLFDNIRHVVQAQTPPARHHKKALLFSNQNFIFKLPPPCSVVRESILFSKKTLQRHRKITVRMMHVIYKYIFYKKKW